MSERTTHLSMPFILPSQAQKHVTHNEALLALDAIVQLSLDGQAGAPPALPGDGARYAVTAPASGLWSGHEGQVAIWQDGAWQFFTPRQGWIAWFRAEAAAKVFGTDGWQNLPAPAPSPDGSFSTLGINAGADASNRLAVASEASLFNHVGHGHQVKINKAAATDTATLLFQSNWTGYAEMGLAGANGFSIKVSDGTTWKTGLTITPGGAVTLPNRPAARAYRPAASFSPTTGSQSGFTTLDPVQGGVTLGLAPGGGGNRVRVPEAGLYLISLLVTATGTAAYSTSLVRNGNQTLFTLTAPATAALSLSHTHIANLTVGDELSLLHTGAGRLTLGPGSTELTLTML